MSVKQKESPVKKKSEKMGLCDECGQKGFKQTYEYSKDYREDVEIWVKEANK